MLGAFAVIYLVWGSMFLAVRVAVHAIPPFVTGATRNLVAGLVLVGIGLASGAARPTAAALWQAFVVGACLFLVNHGGIGWASRRNPSGITALLASTIPLWMAALDRLFGSGAAPSPRVAAGLALGFAGSLLLFWPTPGAPAVDPVAAAVTLLAAVGWAAGTLRTRRMRMSDSPVLATGLPMVMGGLALLVVAAVSGELATFHPAEVPLSSGLALLYLILAGSLLGFSAYVFLLRVVPAARVVTYAYVNPVVALLLGAWLGGEPLGAVTVLAAATSLAGVYLVVSD